MTALDDFADLPEVARYRDVRDDAYEERSDVVEAADAALEAVARELGYERKRVRLWFQKASDRRRQRDYERGQNEVLCIVARKHGEMLRSCEEELDEECTRAERAEAERDEADDRAAYLKGQLLKAKPVTCGECKYMHSGVHGITQWAYCGCEESPMWKYGVDPWGYADFSCSLGKRKEAGDG